MVRGWVGLRISCIDALGVQLSMMVVSTLMSEDVWRMPAMPGRHGFLQVLTKLMGGCTEGVGFVCVVDVPHIKIDCDCSAVMFEPKIGWHRVLVVSGLVWGSPTRSRA